MILEFPKNSAERAKYRKNRYINNEKGTELHEKIKKAHKRIEMWRNLHKILGF